MDVGTIFSPPFLRIGVKSMLAAVVFAACLLAGCSPQPAQQTAPAGKNASAVSAAAGSSNAGAASAAVDASAPGASAVAITLRRTQVQIRFVQMFEQECLPRVASSATLSPAQREGFCQCYAAALADNTSEAQLKRYLAGQDQAQLQRDAEHYGQPCLTQAKAMAR